MDSGPSPRPRHALRSIADYLAEHPFFTGLPADLLEHLAGCARNLHVATDTYLLRTGEPADTFYAVRHGRVSLEVPAPAGSVVIDSAHEGDIVGWSWLIPPHRCRFDARTSEPTSLVAFDAACLRGKAEADPALGYALVLRVAEVMDHRLQSARVRLLDVYGAHA